MTFTEEDDKMKTQWDDQLNRLASEGIELAKALTKFGVSIYDKLPRFEEQTDENERNRIAIAKKQLMIPLQLITQVFDTLGKGNLLLSLIGLRVILEEYFNTKYIFEHPNHIGELSHVQKVCREIFNNQGREIQYNKLDGKSVKDRAKEIGAETLYDKDYSSLSSYIHASIQSGKLSDPKLFKEYSAHAYLSALSHTYNIVEIIVNQFQLQTNKELENKIREFLPKIIEYENAL